MSSTRRRGGEDWVVPFLYMRSYPSISSLYRQRRSMRISENVQLDSSSTILASLSLYLHSLLPFLP